MKITGSVLLVIAAIAVLCIALLHIAIIFLGRKAYGYFGAAQLIPLVEKGSPWPTVITFLLAGVFAVCGLYGLSGAGVLPHLPLLRIGLMAVSAVFTLRGLALIKEIPKALRMAGAVPQRELVFSSVSLVTGLLFLSGLILRWHDLA